MNKTHDETWTPLYGIWRAMRNRCNNPNNAHYARYGGRGIVVCPEWDDFLQFKADMGPRPSLQHTVDRKDNDGPYSKENCRWATRREQSNNIRTNRLITCFGETHSVSEWARKIGLKRITLQKRLDNNKRRLPLERLLDPTPIPYSRG